MLSPHRCYWQAMELHEKTTVLPRSVEAPLAR